MVDVLSATIVFTRNSRGLRPCNRQVIADVSIRPVKIAPSSLLLPKQIFLHWTALLSPRSETLFVGSTPS
ncbi:hypothetical protein MBAV_006304 [Candidatus Magnetobacterium bavaricum]|uniref:Uncharacterized protein n=1 Tax=Candidatus Magnetobacterium bavaricum TaxID=29290 RepID=A0A0F3GI47_9BACT|nr:hypothetical protein MBAV_006304 [Candidatus Magnetobacterium bavaricum]